MVNIKIRPQKVSDAKRFYDILNNDNFIYFGVDLKSVEDERKYLRKNAKKRKDNFEYNYAIILDKKVVGACGIKIDQHSPYIGEIGYFVDENHWGKGIATKSVELLEKIAFNKLKLKRTEILMNPKNTASEKVAIKHGYKKEGLMKKKVLVLGKYHDALLYAKIKS